MRILTISRFRLLRLARQLQLCRLFLAALALRFQWSCPGQTWQSVPPFVHSVDFRLQVSVVVIIASTSVSKGFAWWELDGVEMSEARGRPCTLSAEGITSDANVSCDGFSISRVVAVCTVKPVFSFLS